MIISVLQHKNEAKTAPLSVWETLSSFLFRFRFCTHPWVTLPERFQQTFRFGHLPLTSPCGVRAATLPQTNLPEAVNNLLNAVNVM